MCGPIFNELISYLNKEKSIATNIDAIAKNLFPLRKAAILQFVVWQHVTVVVVVVIAVHVGEHVLVVTVTPEVDTAEFFKYY